VTSGGRIAAVKDNGSDSRRQRAALARKVLASVVAVAGATSFMAFGTVGAFDSGNTPFPRSVLVDAGE
jgi:hypothetical protein